MQMLTKFDVSVGGEVERAIDFHGHFLLWQGNVNGEQLVFCQVLIFVRHSQGLQAFRHICV